MLRPCIVVLYPDRRRRDEDGEGNYGGVSGWVLQWKWRGMIGHGLMIGMMGIDDEGWWVWRPA
jgi:hypothetical protein